MSRIISRTELARMAGVSQAAITKQCRGALAPACQGSRIDVSHPAVQAYLQRRARPEPHQLSEEAAHARTGPVKAPRNRSAAPPAPGPAPQTEPTEQQPPSPGSGGRGPVRLVSREVANLAEVADMTIREVVQKFGTVTAFKDWLAALRTIEEVREKNLRNAETDGNLISIRLVQTHVMGALESGNRRLLTDAPKTIARQAYAAAKVGTPIEQVEKMVRDVISSQLTPMKDAATRILRNQNAD